MNEKLVRLYNLLISNSYTEDAKRIEQIMEEIAGGATEITIKKLIAMCNPKYLGDLNVKEFTNAYEWWNFLSSISKEAEKII